MLVDGAKMPPAEAFPRALARLVKRQALPLDQGQFTLHADAIARRVRALEDPPVPAHRVARHAWLLLTCTLLGLAAGILQTRVNPPPGSAWFEMTLAYPNIDGAPIFVSPESAFRSTPLIKRTFQELGVPNLSDAAATFISRELTFERQGDQSQLWRGEYKDATAQRAVEFLRKHLEIYLDSELDKALRVVRSNTDFLVSQVDDARKGLRVTEAELSELGEQLPKVSPKELQAQRQALNLDYEAKRKKYDTLVADLEARRMQLEMERASSRARYDIITPPTVEEPSIPAAMIRRGGMGGGVGFALALCAALLLERRLRITDGNPRQASG